MPANGFSLYHKSRSNSADLYGNVFFIPNSTGDFALEYLLCLVDLVRISPATVKNHSLQCAEFLCFARMFHSNYQLSFGVELEFMFVFHEKLLIGQLRIDSGKRPFTKKDGAPLDTPTLLRHQASIQKDLPDEVREELRQGAQHYRFHHPHYPSWGLSTPRSQSAKDKRPFEKNRIEGMRMTRADDGTMIRTYDLEPIRMAREVLLSNGAYDMWRGSEHLSSITGLRIGTRSGAGQHKPVLEFKHWHVTSDYSLSGFDQDELAAYLEKYKVCNSRDGSGASPFSNGLATNSITHLYRPASDSSSSQSQGLSSPFLIFRWTEIVLILHL